MKPYHNYVSELLDEGISVLIYAGDADFICNWIGNKAWVKELQWSGHKLFNSAQDHMWVSTLSGKEAGEILSYDKLTFLRVYEAGHMVTKQIRYFPYCL